MPHNPARLAWLHLGRVADARPGRILLLVSVWLIAVSGWLGAEALQTLRYDRAALEAGQWWRLLAAHLVHLGPRHGLLNATALLLIVWMNPCLRKSSDWLWLTMVSLASVDAGLYWLFPAVDWYVGASGVLHGLFAGAALQTLVQGGRREGLTLLAALAAKLTWEGTVGPTASGGAGPGFQVVTASHLLGAWGGLLGALLLLRTGPTNSEHGLLAGIVTPAARFLHAKSDSPGEGLPQPVVEVLGEPVRRRNSHVVKSQ